MQVALTGCATGIGASVAAKLKAEGGSITAFDLIEPKDNTDKWIKTDFSDPQSIQSAIAKSEGPYDALINNAGVPPKEGEAEFVLNVNFLGLRHFLNGMLSKLAPDAAIVNTASRAGAHWHDNLDQIKALMALQSPDELGSFVSAHSIDYVRAYNLSKEALIVMTMAETKNMAARGLRMNSVSPAAVSTDILDDFVNAFGEKVANNLKRVGRAGTADEVADVIVFLSRPESHWVRGNDVVIDGGMSAMITAEKLGL